MVDAANANPSMIVSSKAGFPAESLGNCNLKACWGYTGYISGYILRRMGMGEMYICNL